jgi:uncharacterized FlaG/YvyC family protein
MEINPLTSIAPPMPIDPANRPSGNTELVHATIAAVRALNRSELFGSDRELHFSRDSDTREPVVRVVDRKTGELVEQIPPQQILDAMAALARLEKDGARP